MCSKHFQLIGFQTSNSLQGRIVVGNILVFIIVVAIFVLIYQVRNYLHSKPLGLQTVLDNLAKDSIIILGLRVLMNWTLFIKVVSEYNYYIALGICKLELFLGMALMVQCSTFSVVRYLFVFHFNFINSKSERKIKIISRTCVVVLATLCIIIDDNTNTRKFLYLTHDSVKEGDEPKKKYLSLMSTIVIACLSILIMIIVQARIVHEKRKTPELQKMYKWDYFNLKTVSLALFIVVISVSLTVSKAFVNNYEISLLSSMLRDYIIVLVIILLLIKSNSRMSEYVKKRIIPEFIRKDMEMWRRIYSNPTTESHETLPSNLRTSDSELNACNNSPNPQSNQVQQPNIFVISESVDHVGGRNLPNQINMNVTSYLQPSRNTLPDVSM